jgi:hypothetical protein
MTRQLYIISTTLLIISACGQYSIDDKKAVNLKVVSADTAIVLNDTIPPQDNLEIARQFAENFLPDTTMESGMKKMNTFPDSVVKAFKAIRTDRQNQERYLTLIYLKIYRGHLQCCHQSYELRAKPNGIGIDSIADPLLFEYNLITKQFDNNKGIEMINSAIADTWVERNKNLLSDNQIKKEYRLIKTIQKNIEKGIYW